MESQLETKLGPIYNLIEITAKAIWQRVRERRGKWDEIIQREGESGQRMKEVFDRLLEDMILHFSIISSNIWWVMRWRLDILRKYPHLRRKALWKLDEALSEIEELKRKVIFLFDLPPLKDLEGERDTAIYNLKFAENVISQVYPVIKSLEESETLSSLTKEAIEAIRNLRSKQFEER
jgi:hypothetical protein